jgi:hypothetical protein
MKAKPRSAQSKAAKGAKGAPSLEEFLGKRDYTGALALLEFQLKCQDGDMKELLLWIGYVSFHLGNFRRAEEAYKELLESYDVTDDVHLNLACCYFYQQMYEEAERAALKGPSDSLQNRILFNISHRMGDEAKLMQFHQNLKDKKVPGCLDGFRVFGLVPLTSHPAPLVPRTTNCRWPPSTTSAATTKKPPTFTNVCCWKTARTSR